MSAAIQKQELIEELQRVVEASTSEATRRAYAADMDRFRGWSESQGFPFAPATEETVGLYLVYLASIGRKTSTIARAKTAINKWHTMNGYPPPGHTARVRTLQSGISRIYGAKKARANAITWKILNRMLEQVEGNAIGIRDRALLLLGFATALRRAELVSLNVEDIEFVDEGLIVTVRRSKTDQVGEGRRIPVPFVDIPGRCPVRAVRHLIGYNDRHEGPIFYGLGSSGRKMLDVTRIGRLSPGYVAITVKKYAHLAGYDSSKFSGHSLRSGFATSAAAAGLPDQAIMRHTGHKSHAVMMGYVQEGTLFTDHPLTAIVSKSTPTQTPEKED